MRHFTSSRVRPVAIAVSALMVPSMAHAQCSSAARYASTIWETYIDDAREAGCLMPVKGPLKTAACMISAPAIALKLFDRMVGWWNSMASGGWATIGPRRVGPEWESGTLWGTSGRLFLGTAPVASSTKVEVTKRDGRAPAEVVVCAFRDDGSARELGRGRFDKGTDNQNRTLTFLYTDLAAELVSVKVDAKDWVPTNKFEYRVRVTTEPDTSGLGPVTGFADLHLHQAAELGFGGNNIWGSHIGPKAEALEADGMDRTMEQAVLKGPIQWVLGLHSLPGLVLSEGTSRHGGGYPDFEDWPHFNDVTHQQVHEDWLKAAHEAGLNLVVVSAVNFEGFCYGLKAMYPRPGDRMRCRDMENIERQLRAFIEMDEQRDWYEIAVHPWHARQIIHDGKLAVVVSLEASHLLPADEGDFVDQLDRLRGMGLRTLQLAHETDSRFAGAAPHRTLFSIFNTIKWYPYRAGLQGFVKDEDGKNVMGLTDKGVRLAEAMMERNMLIDVAHLSERSAYDLYQLSANRHDFYPLYDSHTRFESILTDEDLETQREFLTTDAQIDLIRRTGGMVGLRTGQNAILTVTGPGEDEGVVNDCDGSSKSFAQLVHYGRNHHISMGFGSDLNGFINQLGPRFGKEACPKAGTDAGGKGQREAQVDSVAAPCTIGGAEEGRDFAHDGLRHVGYLPDVVADLEALDTPGIEILESSAEAFLRMWERTYDADRGRVPDDTDLAAETAASVPPWSPCGESRGALEGLEGDWIRVTSNNAPNDGMRVHFEGDRGTLTAMPPTGSSAFRVGQVLWEEVQPDGSLGVRGSDGRYYPSLLTREGADRLQIDVDRENSPGNDQTWERAGPSIDGTWVLQSAPDAANVGLQVQVQGDEGKVRFMPASVTARVRVGNTLWRDIRGGGEMEARVDRDYRPARLELVDADRLRVEIEGPDGPIAERWVRQGSEAEQIGETEKNLVPVVQPGVRKILETGIVERPILSLLAQANDSIESPSWGTISMGGESLRFLVLGCQIGSAPQDDVFVRGAGEMSDGRPLEVVLERSGEPSSRTESASILLGEGADREAWSDPGSTSGRGRGTGAQASLFQVEGGVLRVEAPFHSPGQGAPRDVELEVSCGG